jgi:hypothetical protein
MNSINKTIHAELKKQGLPDTVENAKPVLQYVVSAAEKENPFSYINRSKDAEEKARGFNGEVNQFLYQLEMERNSDKQTWGGF